MWGDCLLSVAAAAPPQQRGAFTAAAAAAVVVHPFPPRLLYSTDQQLLFSPPHHRRRSILSVSSDEPQVRQRHSPSRRSSTFQSVTVEREYFRWRPEIPLSVLLRARNRSIRYILGSTHYV